MIENDIDHLFSQRARNKEQDEQDHKWQDEQDKKYPAYLAARDLVYPVFVFDRKSSLCK